MENLKKFDTQEDYQEWKDGDDYVYPNVCKVGDEIIYNDYPESFWIEALEDIRVWQGVATPDKESTHMSYSFDKNNWVAFTTSTDDWVIVRTGEKVYFRSTYIPSTQSGIGRFYISGKCNIGGNILSLIYGDDYFTKESSFPQRYLFHCLFNSEGRLDITYNKIINAGELILPETVGYYCYYRMFDGCKDLIMPPRLPARKLVKGCYNYMFYGCSSITKAPSLLAESHEGEFNYAYMFHSCSSLSYIKMMSVDIFNLNSRYISTLNWVSGVSATGTFIANVNRTDFTRGVSGIPEGWDLYLYDEDNDRYVIKFKVNGIPYEYYTDEPRDVTWQEFIDSSHNTNGFKNGWDKVWFGSEYVLLNGDDVSVSNNIRLNESYTIGQPTETTEE